MLSDIRSWALLALILGIGLFLRADNVGWGLPDYHVPDERVFTAQTWDRMASQPPSKSHFVYPHLQIRTTAFIHAAASWLGGDDSLATQVLRGRLFGVAISVLTVLLAYAIGRELFGRPVALAGAAFLAVSPFPVVAAHTNLSDGALTFWIASSFLMAARGSRSGHPGWLLASGLLAGLAAAAKYPGLAAVVPPLWACLFTGDLRGTPRVRSPRAILAIASGVLVCCAAGFFAGCPRCVTEWGLCVESIQAHRELIYELGSGSSRPTGLLGYPYVYQLVVVHPFALGALTCLLAYLGLADMTRSAPRRAALIFAFVIPYFGVIGGSGAVFARYCLPLAPFLCLGGGHLAVRLLQTGGWRRGVAALVVVAALVHALLFAYAQVDGFVGENRSHVVSWLETRTAEWAAARPKSLKPTVGHPIFSSKYDGIVPGLRQISTLRFVGVLPQTLERKTARPDFVVLSMPFFLRALRQEALTGGSIWKQFDEEGLGYRRVAEFPPRFRGEGIYSVLDPLQVHAWTNGDIGFWVYEKLPAAAR